MLTSRDQLRPSQVEGIAWLKNKQRGMIGDEPGIGKTAQAAFAAHDVAPHSMKLIAAPTYACYMWRDCLETWFPEDKDSIAVAQGNPDDRFAQIERYAAWTIINIEMLRTHHPKYRKNPIRKIATDYSTMLSKMKYQVFIIDESHRLRGRDRKSAQSEGARIIGDKVPYVFELTGTPIYDKADDLFMQFKILDPHNPNLRGYWDWVERYCRISKTPWGIKVLGTKDQEELNQYMSQYCLRRTAADIDLELPERLPSTRIPVQITKEMRDYYIRIRDEYRMDLISEFHDAQNIPIMASGAAVAHLRQFTSVPESYVKGTGSPKIEALRDYINNDLSSTSKAVIFSWYKETATSVQRILGSQCGLATGDIEAEERYKQAKQFATDPNMKYISCTIGAMSEVVDLSAADTVIFLERDWSFGANEQAIKRVQRPGSIHKRVRILDFYIPGTYDATILNSSERDKEDAEGSYSDHKLEILEGLGF